MINNNILVDGCKRKIKLNVFGKKGSCNAYCLFCVCFPEEGGGECLLCVFQKKGGVKE